MFNRQSENSGITAFKVDRYRIIGVYKRKDLLQCFLRSHVQNDLRFLTGKLRVILLFLRFLFYRGTGLDRGFIDIPLFHLGTESILIEAGSSGIHVYRLSDKIRKRHIYLCIRNNFAKHQRHICIVFIIFKFFTEFRAELI